MDTARNAISGEPRSGLPGLQDLLRLAPRRRLALVGLLMVFAAMSEGMGIALLVPLLQFAGGGAQALPASLGRIGLPTAIEPLLGLFVALVALRAALVFWLGKYRTRLHQELTDGLRRRCYAALVQADWRWLAGQRSADHNAVLVSNGAQVGTGFDAALSLIFNAVTALVLLGVSASLSWRVTLLAVLCGALTMLAIRRLFVRSHADGEAGVRAQRAIHRQVERGLGQTRETKILGTEAADVAGFADTVKSLRGRKQAHRDNLALGSALVQVGAALLLAMAVYAGLVLFRVPLAHLLPMMLVFLRLAPLTQAFQQGWSQWLHAVPAFREVMALIAEAEAHAEPQLQHGAPIRLTKAIKLSRVTVTHDGREVPALAKASLQIPAGTVVAITGPSGAGKSTLADVIAGLIAPDEGSLAIDGEAITPETRLNWRSAVAYVQQSPFLEHGTIRQNLLWATPQADESELIAALKDASADFVLALPEGLDTVIGDDGLRLSGGERQRIALARALLRDPALLILDEATSALDAANEAAILDAVRRLRGTITVVMIGHRPAMLDLADKVIEMDGGRIV